MTRHAVVEALTEIVDRPLEAVVGERGDAPTGVADEVVVMVLAVGHRRLVAGGAATGVESLHEPHLLQQLERPVDGGDADLSAAGAQLIGDLARREHALLIADQLEHGAARGARAMAGLAELILGPLDPRRRGRCLDAR